jgi:hypothetical protein
MTFMADLQQKHALELTLFHSISFAESMLPVCAAADTGDAEDFYDGNARDNATAAIGFIILHEPHLAGDRLHELLVFWCRHLPLTFDNGEAANTLAVFLSLVPTLPIDHPIFAKEELPRIASYVRHVTCF